MISNNLILTCNNANCNKGFRVTFSKSMTRIKGKIKFACGACGKIMEMEL